MTKHVPDEEVPVRGIYVSVSLSRVEDWSRSMKVEVILDPVNSTDYDRCRSAMAHCLAGWPIGPKDMAAFLRNLLAARTIEDVPEVLIAFEAPASIADFQAGQLWITWPQQKAFRRELAAAVAPYGAVVDDKAWLVMSYPECLIGISLLRGPPNF